MSLIIFAACNSNGFAADHDIYVINRHTHDVIAAVATNPHAIGRAPLGILDDSVKIVSADEDPPKVTFYIVIQDEINPLRDDFISFVLSNNYTTAGLAGTVMISGCAAMGPVMKQLVEAYTALNPNVTVDVRISSSNAGITDAVNALVDIAMSSRSLNTAESAQVSSLAISHDTLAVIVHPTNPITGLAGDDVSRIFSGGAAIWNEFID